MSSLVWPLLLLGQLADSSPDTKSNPNSCFICEKHWFCPVNWWGLLREMAWLALRSSSRVDLRSGNFNFPCMDKLKPMSYYFSCVYKESSFNYILCSLIWSIFLTLSASQCAQSCACVLLLWCQPDTLIGYSYSWFQITLLCTSENFPAKPHYPGFALHQ